uniref:Uncharacterized protein n=1 Tax=Anopheles melas TaxID=34690 RepID=A0A182UII5_9DIPT
MQPRTGRASSSFKHNASFVARLPTIRRHKSQSLHSPGNPKPPSGGSGRTGRCPRVTDINASSENLEVTNNGRPMNPSLSEDSVAETALSKKNSDANNNTITTTTITTAPTPVNRPYRGPIPIIDRISSSFPVAAGDEIAPQPLDRADRQEQPHRYRIVRFRTPFEALFRGRSASTAIAAAAAATVAASGSSHLPGRVRRGSVPNKPPLRVNNGTDWKRG